MREKHIVRVARLAQECRALFHPLSLDFTGCPLEHRKALIHYERARDDADIRQRVAFIRSGSIEGPGYWSPDPDFGWPEWPEASFLSVDVNESARRLGLSARPPDPWIAALPLLDKGTAKLLLNVDENKSREEQVTAFIALLEAHKIGQRARTPSKPRRKASMDQIESQMLGIALVRLRSHFTAAETMILLESTGWAGAYTEQTSMDRNLRAAKKDQCAFSLLAREAMDKGTWFFPFCNAFLNI